MPERTSAGQAECTARTGRQPGEVAGEPLAGYLDELANLRTLDDFKTGRVQPVEPAQAMKALQEKSKAPRAEGHDSGLLAGDSFESNV